MDWLWCAVCDVLLTDCFITGNLDLWTFSLFCPYLSFEDPFSFIAVALFIILYKLHVCTITFQLLYTQPHAHHQKFSFHWSPFSWSLSSFFPPPPLHTPSPLVTTTLISASMNYVLSWSFINLFIYQYYAYEKNHMVIVSLCLTYFT